MRIPFASNKYFQLVLAIIAVLVIIKLLISPQENVKMQIFVIAVAVAVFIRSIYKFFKG